MSQEPKAGPKPVDIKVGANIRARRRALHISQEALATSLNLTFQQVQKYENGTNRVSASALFIIAKSLNCTVRDLFAGCDEESETANEVEEVAAVKEMPTNWLIHARAVDRRNPRLLDKLASLSQDTLVKIEGIADAILNATQPEAA
ncbi:helix-turn-helix domain-containing protein [Asticcacaulis taihuensis]|uniref:helix-turn-helix domain-containing protein n=1 Tax=Asticcacaulis taihuensis TaxID=260084 RepID=UPI0026EF7002|nr:helix-turn-helix transcriptional regulator [Asticcacaulis taihuensis]